MTRGIIYGDKPRDKNLLEIFRYFCSFAMHHATGFRNFITRHDNIRNFGIVIQYLDINTQSS